MIINADDFGFSREVNRAVLRSFSEGLCSSTTITPGMPGFEEACEMSFENGLAEHVGLHLILSEGNPLSDSMKKCRRFCNEDGQFKGIGRSLFRLSSAEREALSEEICAQIDRCREFGLPITHIDSHHHVHNQWAVAGVLLRVAKAKKVPYIRLARNCRPNTGWVKVTYKWGLNKRIRLKGLAATRYMGTVNDYVYAKRHIPANSNIGSFEIMVHPVFDETGMLIDKISKEPLDQYVAKVVDYKSAISFGKIAVFNSIGG